MIIGWPPQSSFLTQREWLASYLALVAAVIASLAAREVVVGFAIAVPMLAFSVYRSRPRFRAAKRAGLVGFIEQLPAVSEAERRRKLDALADELGDRGRGRVWLRELDARLIKAEVQRHT